MRTANRYARTAWELEQDNERSRKRLSRIVFLALVGMTMILSIELVDARHKILAMEESCQR